MRISTACAALVLAASAMGAGASEIYQWTDARGVTHYSGNPPPAGTQYQTRRITSAGASTQAEPAPAASAAAADAGENPQCTTARSNIEILLGDGPVHQDDGEGNSRELGEDERANQLELARAAERAYCTQPAGGS